MNMETGQLENGQIKLVLGGETVLTSFATLSKAPAGSILHGVQHNLWNHGCTYGTCHIDRSPDGFQHILDFLRYETVPEQSLREDIEFGKRLKQQAEFYGIADMVNKIDEICGFPKKKVESGESSRGEVLLKFKNGEIIKTSLATLKKAPESSCLKDIYSHFDRRGGYFWMTEENRLPYFIDRDPTYFHHVINFLQTESLPNLDVKKVSDAAIDEAKFYGLQEMLGKVEAINE